MQMVTQPQRFANDPTNAEELKEITQFAKILVANQIFTKGFTLGAGTYMDLIPSEIKTIWSKCYKKRYTRRTYTAGPCKNSKS